MSFSKKILLALGCGLLLSTGAAQASGLISVTGSVRAGTCMVNGDQNNVAVSLPPVQGSQLSVPGEVAGNTPFAMSLSECSPGLTRVYTYFEPGPMTSPEGRLIVDGGGSQNVEVQLLNSDSKPMNLAGDVGNQQSQVVDIIAGKALLNYSAEYYSLGQTTPGLVSTRVRYTLMYP